jgi:WD40 repeat protein
VAISWWVEVWDVASGTFRSSLKGHGGPVWGVAAAPGGRLLSGAEDGLVKVWDPETGAEVRSYDWGIGKVRAVAVAPDGLTAAAAGDGVVAVWDVED